MYQRDPYHGDYEREHETYRSENLHRLSDLDDWQISEDEPDIRGWTMFDRDGNKIGHIDDLLVDTDRSEAIYAIVGYGGTLGIGKKHTIIPLDRTDIDYDNNRLNFYGTMDDVHSAPEWTADTHDYVPYHDYWSGRTTATREYRETEEHPTEERAEHRERVIPEVEEHLEAEKHAEQVGEAVVRKDVETHKETVQEPVKRTRVRVFRRPVEPGREPRMGEQALREGEEMTIPIVEEHLEVEKRAEVTGEVVVEPETYEEEEEVTGEVHREHVEVEKRGEADFDEEKR